MKLHNTIFRFHNPIFRFDYLILQQDITYLKGVGPERAKLLGKELQIKTVGNLLWNLPTRHIDRSKIVKICDLPSMVADTTLFGGGNDERSSVFVQLYGQIVSFSNEGTGRRNPMKAVFSDGTGFVELVWFRGFKYVTRTYKVRTPFLLLGRLSVFNGHYSFAHPELDEVKDGRIEVHMGLRPHYALSETLQKRGITSKVMSGLVANALSLLENNPPVEVLPDYVVRREQFMTKMEAFRAVHFPKDAGDLTSGQQRLKYEEFFYLQLNTLQEAALRNQHKDGFVFSKVGSLFNDFYNRFLPFSLTEAQKKVLRQIRQDLGSGIQMNRLLQGDVGSGKTIVALFTLLLALDNGFQACIMAPTEILAEQHYATFSSLLAQLPVEVALLTGNVKGAARKKILEGVKSGKIDILVGTHALIEPTVAFRNLGLAIIDEQHRFGVKQRAQLWQKNLQPPHILVMTATPIPRTLAMTLYGDLDVSVIDELPPGRKPIETRHFYQEQSAAFIELMHEQLAAHHQIYIVYPLIEHSEKIDLGNAVEGYERFRELFPNYTVELLHGRMNAYQKDDVVQQFVRGEVNILVSTTVIEVGVNVPNATMMAIMEAQRFGLSQLHQLRGRVGRGADKSFCVLVTPNNLSVDAEQRILTMCNYTDGFLIAEEDLRLRGPGNIQSTQQSGIHVPLRVASIMADTPILEKSRNDVKEFLQIDPALSHPNHAAIKHELKRVRDNNLDFSNIS